MPRSHESLQAEIAELRDKNAELEAKLAELRDKNAKLETALEGPACNFTSKFGWPTTLHLPIKGADRTAAGIQAHFNEPRKRIRAIVEKLPDVAHADVSTGRNPEADDQGVSLGVTVVVELVVGLGRKANDEDLKAAARAFQHAHLEAALQEVPEVGVTVNLGNMRKR